MAKIIISSAKNKNILNNTSLGAKSTVITPPNIIISNEIITKQELVMQKPIVAINPSLLE